MKQALEEVLKSQESRSAEALEVLALDLGDPVANPWMS